MYCTSKVALGIFFTILLLVSFAQFMVNAQQDDFVLEAEQRWETYGVGGTCIPGTHNLAVADIDNDGVNEMITGGFSYMITNGTRASLEAPLKIWSYNGQNLTLEKSESWAGAIWVVYSADPDGDGKTEIITSGAAINGTEYVSALKFWNWNGQTLTLRGTYYDIAISSLWVGDLNKDGTPEMVTVERHLNATESVAQLSIWHWNGNQLTLKNSVTWGNGNGSQANTVSAGDLNNDGTMEIVTAGYDNGLKNSSGQLRIWQWNGTNINLQSNAEWRMIENTYASDVAGNPMGNTLVNNVKINDINSDSVREILTGGFTYDGTKVKGQLRVWNWNGTLNLKASEEWAGYDITELKSITVNDADGDGKVDIITSGVTAGSGGFSENATIKEYAQLRVWSWEGQTLTLKQSKDWNVDEGVCAWQIGTGDLDNDGKIEVVTVGCSYKSTLCDPNMRIWSLPAFTESTTPVNPPTTASYAYIAIAGVGSIIAISALIFMIRRKH